ncbi:hypothetical protein COB21_05750 [Candidatus Aerophobetes bacterium]|uniref:Uncharacterized protein n=1 Tax=Aerophobetes bacterium TaxID=2030807 RepID=A0A2A4WYI7_UNCAE|nr:MAG: hypothetical protein COB21_05750 [Candidatus Aerophobetes bacterium]
MKKLTLKKQTTPHLELEAITLVERIHNKELNPVQTETLEVFFKLFEKRKFRKAYSLLQNLLVELPKNPYLLDYQALTLIQRKRLFKSRKVVEQNYLYNPSILFVKVRYADLLIQKKQPHLVEELFTLPLDLKKLYPKQTTFLLSDYVAFMSMAAWYHYSKKEQDQALIYAYMVKNITKSCSSINCLLKKMYRKKRRFRFRKK